MCNGKFIQNCPVYASKNFFRQFANFKAEKNSHNEHITMFMSDRL